MKLFVGNLSSDISPGLLREAFSAYGIISSISITQHGATDEIVCVVEMPNLDEAATAVMEIDGKVFNGHSFHIKNRDEIDKTEKIPEDDTAASVKPIDDSLNAPIDNLMEIEEDKRQKENDRRQKPGERREIDSPLFKSDKGIVIDRRTYSERRNKPDRPGDAAP